RLCIQEAVKFIVSKTPQTYYHYGANGQAMAAGAAPKAAPAVAAVGGAGAAGGKTVASAPPADASRPPPAAKAPESIRTDLDKQVVADLNEAKVRGQVLSVVVTLRGVGDGNHPTLNVVKDRSSIMNYDTGEKLAMIDVDGFTGGTVKNGDVKTVRATFKAPPKGTKAGGITISGVGTVDDVDLAQQVGGAARPAPGPRPDPG